MLEGLEGRIMHLGESKKQLDIKMIATGVGHEMKGPLSTIKACAEGILKRLEKNNYDIELFKEYISIIIDEVNRCTFITDNVLTNLLNGIDSERRKIDVHDSLNQIVKMLNYQGRCRNIKIIKKYDDRIQHVQWAEYEFLQVVLAIIVNAIDAMRGEGTLTIETRLHLDVVFIAINNTGDPISKENLESIFLPFYTTKSMQGGTGLGLFIARNMVDSAGGNIKVVSDELDGTTFTITLPFLDI